MELPKELKDLYRHWPRHTAVKMADTHSVFVDPEYEKSVRWFVSERIQIWKNKTQGKSKPYTNDTILQTYRFCNIFREFDKQTIAFHTILNPIRNDFDLWLLNMFYFRMVASIDTIKLVGNLSYDTKENDTFYKKLMASPRPRYGTPYVFPVSTIMQSPYPTRELFIAHYLPQVMQKISEEIATWKNISVVDGMRKVLPLFGFDIRFLWNEVLIDVAYQYPERIDLFKDFPVGPGSLPTLAQINPDIKPQKLASLLPNTTFKTDITYNGKELRLSAENWEGIGCEFRKYTNLTSGKGRKRLYR